MLIAGYLNGWANWFFNNPKDQPHIPANPYHERKLNRPAQIVYRRELTVSETIYTDPSYRPVQKEMLYPWEMEEKLKRVNFRDV